MAELILKVTPEEVRTKAKQIQDKQQQMEGLMDQMKSLVNGLNDCFDSDSGRLYQEKYTNVTKNIQASLEKLQSWGVRVLAPQTGRLACGDEGPGRMPEPEAVLAALAEALQ